MYRGLILAALTPILALGTVSAQTPPRAPTEATGEKAMVVAVSPPAVDVGVAVLKQGGNSVDAAVAVAFAMAVTYPAAGNIGGGGFMVVHPPEGKPVVIDYREMAPKAAHAKMFTREDTWFMHKAVGVPGTVRGLELAHKKFGSRPWKDLVLPAVELAEKGFLLDAHTAASLNAFLKSKGASKEAVRVFSKEGKAEWKAGDRLVQPDLARTLRQIAEGGAGAFYRGPIADQLVAEMKRGNGIITKEDLAAYTAREREPIHTRFRGHDIYGAPPPSSGGITLGMMLNMLEPMNLREKGRWSPETLHLLIETMRRAYVERARHLGDTDFVEVPVSKLTSKEFARDLAQTIDPKKATKSESLAKDIPLKA